MVELLHPVTEPAGAGKQDVHHQEGRKRQREGRGVHDDDEQRPDETLRETHADLIIPANGKAGLRRPAQHACLARSRLARKVSDCQARLIVWNDSNDDASVLTRSVELTEKNVLPARQAEGARDQRDGLRGTHQPRLEVRIAVAVPSIVQPNALGNELPQEVHHVGLHTRVPIFLDQDRRGRALGVDRHQAVADTGCLGHCPHRLGDVDQGVARVGCQMDDVAHDRSARTPIGLA